MGFKLETKDVLIYISFIVKFGSVRNIVSNHNSFEKLLVQIIITRKTILAELLILLSFLSNMSGHMH